MRSWRLYSQSSLKQLDLSQQCQFRLLCNSVVSYLKVNCFVLHIAENYSFRGMKEIKLNLNLCL